jgi:hypothetical protein
MKNMNRFRFRKGKMALFSSIIGSASYLIMNDLKKENSFIKAALKSIPFLKKHDISHKDNAQIESTNMKEINRTNQQ